MNLDNPRVLERTYTVTDDEAIHFMGSGVTPVLSTPALLNWMEMASRENAKGLLNEGEDTVGVSVEMKHLAATPVGMKVRVVSKLRALEARIYTFEVEAHDEVEKIGEGTHRRASVSVAWFASKIAAKKEKVGRTG